MHSIVKPLAVFLLVAGSTACAEDPSPGTPCSGPGSCGDELICCSTDATALDFSDLVAIVLPAYPGHNPVGGVPLFSGDANNLSGRGICIIPGTVPPPDALDNACPVPCNPTWSAVDVEAVCGVDSLCCQMEALEVEDCVLDLVLGDQGCWRPVTGADIGVLTTWGVNEHATHQDPGLRSDGPCAMLVAGLAEGVDAEAVENACIRRLTVANQRGNCVRDQPALICPEDLPDYRDACDQLNDDQGRSGCS